MESTHLKPLVLFVEDEAPFHMIYRDILDRQGFDFRGAKDGEEGWAMIQADHPDVIVLDIIMPNMSGIDLLKKIRGTKETKDISVLMFSVIGEEKEMKQCMRAGANDYAVKGSFDPSEIVGMIKTLIDNPAHANIVGKGKRGRMEVHTTFDAPWKKKKKK